MVLTDEPAGLGVLITIQRHACAEVQRGTEPERKEYLYTIVDITMHLLVTHTIQYCEQNVLSRGAKDELRKRLSTVFSRLRTTIPPPPQHSVIHSFELDEFCKQLKET